MPVVEEDQPTKDARKQAAGLVRRVGDLLGMFEEHRLALENVGTGVHSLIAGTATGHDLAIATELHEASAKLADATRELHAALILARHVPDSPAVS